MSRRILGLVAMTSALVSAAGAALAQGAPTAIPLDTETVIGDMSIACTGIGQSKDDPKWKAYPVRLEFSNPSGDLLADEAVTVSGGGGVASVSCEGPWILLRAPAGVYKIEAWLPEGTGGNHQTARVKAPATGLKIVEFQFHEP